MIDPARQAAGGARCGLVLAETAQRFSDAVDYDDGIAGRLRPDPWTPDVVMDPARSFGQPAVRNVGIDALAEDYRAGATREELADLYDLSAMQVDAALRFESGRESAA